LLFSLLARLSQDSNILHKFVIDDEGMQDLEFVLVRAWSCGMEGGKEERMAAAMTVAATCSHPA
jgi:hypothetical protein